MLFGNNKADSYRLLRIFVVALVIPLAFGICIAHASCAQSPWVVEDGSEENPVTYDLTEYGKSAIEAYEVLVNISYPLAAISFAAGAFRMLTGEEREMESGRKQMVYTLVALAVLFLLPFAVEAGMNLGKTYGWSPP